MYPLHYANLFPPFPRTNRVFVAMGFAKEFDHRWENVIKPGIGRIDAGGGRLEAYRVDANVVGDSILTEILDGISNARLVLADVSTAHSSGGVTFRNANVMYEVGIAHSLRLPEEVLLFRSDKDRLLFDLANIRVNEYTPDTETAQATEKVVNAVFEALKELDLRKAAYVKRAAESLDGGSCALLLQSVTSAGSIAHPQSATFGEVMSNAAPLGAISRMLELGVLKFDGFKLTGENLTVHPSALPYNYRVTDFGRAVFGYLLAKSGFDDPQIQERLAKMASEVAARNPSNQG